ncbi:hypothetical protein AG1IA_04398 [Rhizoctonia solani AG-1 IA]|uniref:Uncharacterized protein n=1 Tax=Thanatephorus cucumeris (strain AG1-IA) TaxID=983506 RepID=L8WYW7_THACA|nr:hypothetical protein AG1IA_04398 [Rhizoctonia solani AG-1 IA]
MAAVANLGLGARQTPRMAVEETSLTDRVPFFPLLLELSAFSQHLFDRLKFAGFGWLHLFLLLLFTLSLVFMEIARCFPWKTDQAFESAFADAYGCAFGRFLVVSRRRRWWCDFMRGDPETRAGKDKGVANRTSFERCVGCNRVARGRANHMARSRTESNARLWMLRRGRLACGESRGGDGRGNTNAKFRCGHACFERGFKFHSAGTRWDGWFA